MSKEELLYKIKRYGSQQSRIMELKLQLVQPVSRRVKRVYEHLLAENIEKSRILLDEIEFELEAYDGKVL